MKKLLQAAIIFLLLCNIRVSAQMVADSVSIQSGYTNQAFYNMQNGTVSSVSNQDWDLGFQLRGFAASIIINSKNGVHLYKSSKDVSHWGMMSPSDTTGLLNYSNELFNSDSSWDVGAFNTTMDTSQQFDLGWGLYDPTSHYVWGDSLYFIKLPTGDYKILMVEVLKNGAYYFRTSNLDNSGEVQDTLTKSNFMGKYFAYFSILNNNAIDREPMYNAWDLVFTQYLTLDINYIVTGVLSNDSVNVARAYPVDINTVGANDFPYRSNINAIGYNWKTFTGTSYLIEDSLVYFVEAKNHTVWKMIFTGFGGSSNGTYYFNKEAVGIAGVHNPGVPAIIHAFPNPADGKVQLVISSNHFNEVNYRIINLLGEVIKQAPLEIQQGLNIVSVPTSDLNNGIYFLSIGNNNHFSTEKIVIQH